MQMLRAMPWYADVLEWMTRANNPANRPMPLLVLQGPTGSGKSAAVAEAARQTGIRVIEAGSDTTRPGQSGTKGAFGNTDSLAPWKAAMAARSLLPQIFVLDDADAVLGVRDHGDAGKLVHAADVLAMAAGNTPMIVVATDMFATPTLQELRKKKDSVQLIHVRSKPISDVHLIRLLGTEFPGESLARIRTTVAMRPGDVRAARLALRYGTVQSNGLADIKHLVTPTHIIFDRVKAALGIAGRLPRTPAEIDAVMHPDARQAGVLIARHYLTAIAGLERAENVPPDLPHGLCALVADALSVADIRSQVSEYLAVRCVPGLIRATRVIFDVATPKTLNFTGPMAGEGAKAAEDGVRATQAMVGGLDQLDLLTLQQQDRLVSCTRTDRKTWPKGRSARMAFARRDELLTLAARYPPPKTEPVELVSSKQLKTALNLAILAGGTKRKHDVPWKLRKLQKT